MKRIGTTLVLSLILFGCSLLRASPARNSGFLPHGEQLIASDPHYPFNGIYFENQDQFYETKSKYKNILIAPINTDLVEKRIVEDPALELFREDRLEELSETARFFHEVLKKSFQHYPKPPLEPVESDTPLTAPTLRLDIVLVELEPTKATLNVLSTIAGFFLPGSGITKPFSSGSIAFEAIFKDAATNKILIELKDRQSDQTSPFSIKDFEAYAHQRKIITDWSASFAKLFASRKDETIEGVQPVTLNPF
jgi:hypothetical protein